jgi:hypothetical protein
MDNNFDITFMSDEELEIAMDEMIDNIKDDINRDEMETTILNPKKMTCF